MKNKIFIILFLGICLRILAGYFVYGFIAFDEYFNIVNPAGEWLFGKEAVYTWKELTRSPFMAIVVYYFMKFLFLFSINDPVILIRIIGIVFGCCSFLLAFFVFRKLQDKAYYFSVFFFVLPFLDTRIMYETITASMVVFALYCFHFGFKEKKFYLFVLSAVIIGLASMIRIQVGVIYIGMLFSFLFYKPFNRKLLLGFLIASLVPLLFQILIDYVFFNGFLTSLFNYIYFQYHNISVYDHQKWYNFILLFFALTLPPASIIFIPALYKSSFKYPCFALSFIFFLVFHSLSPHKEERFMFPVIYVFLFMIAASYYDVKDWFYNWDRSRIYKFLMIYAVSINFVILIPVLFSNTIGNVLEPMRMLRIQSDFRGLISDSPIIPHFYLSYKGKIKIEHDLMKIVKSDFENYNYVLSLNPSNTEQLLIKYPQLKLVKIFKSGMVDRIVYYLNPSKNARRGYSALFVVGKK